MTTESKKIKLVSVHNYNPMLRNNYLEISLYDENHIKIEMTGYSEIRSECESKNFVIVEKNDNITELFEAIKKVLKS